ncbi:phosphomethylpyrimidine synthase ThiC [Kocuria rhizophila]|nr:phosphomethylpyrimidine synthase ThiC [Kocuria rhizophila]
MCYVTPKEHLGLPTGRRAGVIAYEVRPRRGGVAEGHPGAAEARRRAVQGTLRVPLAASCRAGAGPR